MHAAILSQDTKLLSLLIRYGGDLRLHDDEGRNINDYIMLIENVEVKNKLINCINEIKKFAIGQISRLQNKM